MNYIHTHNNKNYEMAKKFWMLSADKGNNLAMQNLGVLYDRGIGTEINYDEAFNWYKKSAEMGNSDCMRNVGYIYEFGKGVKQNFTLAYQWYVKAKNAGSTKVDDAINRVMAKE